MNFEEEQQLLSQVKRACKKNPLLLSRIITAATHGIEEDVMETRQRQSDMEVCMAIMSQMIKPDRLSAQTKQHLNKILCRKMLSHHGQTQLVWPEVEERGA